MKKKLIVGLIGVVVAVAVAAVLIAQGPQVDQRSLRIAPEERAKMSPERAERIQRLIDYGEAFRAGKIQPPPPIDPVQARTNLLDMIAQAGDNEIVVFYMAVREAKATRDRFEMSLERIENRLHEMSGGRRPEY